MHYIASLSGGVPSAVNADLAIKRYGLESVSLWFADTLAEDKDLYRFVRDCLRRWGIDLPEDWKADIDQPAFGRHRWRRRNFFYFCEGRTPEQVAVDHRIIPNQKIAPCTFELKIRPFNDWLWKISKPVTVLLGLDWSEMHRIDERRYWHRYNGKATPPDWLSGPHSWGLRRLSAMLETDHLELF